MRYIFLPIIKPETRILLFGSRLFSAPKNHYVRVLSVCLSFFPGKTSSQFFNILCLTKFYTLKTPMNINKPNRLTKRGLPCPEHQISFIFSFLNKKRNKIDIVLFFSRNTLAAPPDPALMKNRHKKNSLKIRTLSFKE